MESFIERNTLSLGDLVDSLFIDDIAEFSNRGSCNWLISSNHNNLDTSWPAFENCVRDCVSWWVSQRQNTNECLIGEWEIRIFHIEFEAFGEILFRKVIFGKSQYSFSILTEAFIGLCKHLIPFFWHRIWLSIQVNVSTQFPNSLGSTFSENAIMGVWSLEFINRVSELICWIERNSTIFILTIPNNWELLSHFHNVRNGLEEFD